LYYIIGFISIYKENHYRTQRPSLAGLLPDFIIAVAFILELFDPLKVVLLCENVLVEDLGALHMISTKLINLLLRLIDVCLDCSESGCDVVLEELFLLLGLACSVGLVDLVQILLLICE